MSGYGMRGDLDKSKAAGFSAHLIKPFGPVELNEALARVLAPKTGPAKSHAR
jgi:CheY-like chemotaxis protein